jgi:DNA adenine methylase|tara:strand:+ start:4258 stop:5109 length:852 start_codon:yes stop_codon:yes gene_type:complete
MKSLKTPLRYPGGKSRAITKISPCFPNLKECKEFREPFLGGGSVSLYVTKAFPHLTIWVNDLYTPLTNFWQQLQKNPDEITKELTGLKGRYDTPERARHLFAECKECLNHTNSGKSSRAVSFYIVNKCSFSGLSESSSFSAQASESNFSMRGIEKLPGYSELIKDWIITNQSYEKLLCNDWDSKGHFVYMDPPYDIKDNLYGKKGDMHKRFDHDQFAKDCDEYKSPMLISYNCDQLIKDRFSEWNVVEYDHTYTMRSTASYGKDQRERKELLLLNYDCRKTLG